MTDQDETNGIASAMVRGIPRSVMDLVKSEAFRNGVIPSLDGSTSDAVRWVLVQWASAQRAEPAGKAESAT